MKHIFIGIDFSLKSPAICIYKDGTYKWLSHCSKVEKPKKDIVIQEDVASLSDVSMRYQDELLTGTDYSTKDAANMANYRLHASELMVLIIDELKDENWKECEFHFGFEGYSFNSFSQSNNIIDIVAATTSFKNLLMDTLSKGNYTVDIMAPISIQQYAGYSKLDKVDMFDVFTGQQDFVKEKWAEAIAKDFEKKVAKNKPSVFKWDYLDEDSNGAFHDYCCSYEINRDVKKPKVPKPIDDMIDAYFICCLLREKFSAA